MCGACVRKEHIEGPFATHVITVASSDLVRTSPVAVADMTQRSPAAVHMLGEEASGGTALKRSGRPPRSPHGATWPIWVRSTRPQRRGRSASAARSSRVTSARPDFVETRLMLQRSTWCTAAHSVTWSPAACTALRRVADITSIPA